MRQRPAVAPAIAAILLTLTASALADNPAANKPPDPAKIRIAAEQFDAGQAARNDKNFEAAASRFEAADAAAPSAPALRQAIRSRDDAGQLSRAANLAAQAKDRYPDDPQTTKLADEILEKAAAKLHKLSVSCASPCVLAVGPRSIPGEPNTRWTIYLDPGKASLAASFFSGVSGGQKTIPATAGGASDVRFEPAAGNNTPAAAKKTPEPGDSAASNTPNNELPPPDAPPPDANASKPQRSGLPPAVFIVGLIATAGVGGVTLWSAVDTQTNPGPDAVKKECMGLGTSCPAYQEGLKKQTRTNVLIGATAGTAALTTVFAIFTNWHGSDKKPPAKAAWAPSVIVTEHGAVGLATGTF